MRRRFCLKGRLNSLDRVVSFTSKVPIKKRWLIMRNWIAFRDGNSVKVYIVFSFWWRVNYWFYFPFFKRSPLGENYFCLELNIVQTQCAEKQIICHKRYVSLVKNGKSYEVSLNVLVVAVNFQELLGNMRNVSLISLYPMSKLSRTKSFIFHRLFCFVFYEVRISCFRSCIYWCHSWKSVNQSTESTDGSIVSECRLRKWYWTGT